jgi:putative Mg2+ transporter-C (MgtC) family protein
MEANIEVFTKLLVAMFLGAAIGVERTLIHKDAGMRTFSLVSLGAALFVIISNTVFEALGPGSGFDPSRIISQIVVGIGFLAGGMIIFTNHKLEGLTTGAGIWVCAAVGAAVGFGFYAIALFVSILILLVFALFPVIERVIDKDRDRKTK